MFGADTQPRFGTDEFQVWKACSDASRKKLTPQPKCVGNSGAKSEIGTVAGNEKIILKTAAGHYAP